MSDIDLTEATRAGVAALIERWPHAGQIVRDEEAFYRGDVVDVLTAALPHIERQVREQVAREIEARRGPQQMRAGETHTAFGIRAVRDETFTDAARIARGES